MWSRRGMFSLQRWAFGILRSLPPWGIGAIDILCSLPLRRCSQPADDEKRILDCIPLHEVQAIRQEGETITIQTAPGGVSLAADYARQPKPKPAMCTALRQAVRAWRPLPSAHSQATTRGGRTCCR